MRRRAFAVSLAAVAVRKHASYGVSPLTHKEMRLRFHEAPAANTNELALLQQTEELISRWRLNKWEFRIPPLLPAYQKEKLMLQLDVLKGLCLDQSKQLQAVKSDVALVASITGISEDAVRGKTRTWLQEEAAKLRWHGEVNRAKSLRDAFLRLEVYGSPDHRLLERLCCVYGMGMLGTFEGAFSNTIVQDPVTGEIHVEETSSFSQLLAYITSRYPDFDIVYDFLGFNPSTGYRASLSRFLATALYKKAGIETSEANGRILFSDPVVKEVLFDFGDSSKSISADDSVYGLPDLLFIRGGDIVLITVASSNHWLRNRQLPHRKQLEGIGRRASMVMGIPFERVRVRNLLLPPDYVDRVSLQRLFEGVLEMTPAQQKEFFPWVSVYEKELDSRDVDYCELAKTVNAEEWLTL